MRKIILAVLLCVSSLPAFTQGSAHMAARPSNIQLRAWQIQSGCKLHATGDVISTSAFKTSGWQAVTVPTTVLAALVTAGVYRDPYYAMNLRNIPGTSYPIEKKFAELPMPDDSPFNCAWWYRAEFQLPANYRGRSVALHFDGINYRANIWVNGKLIANSKDVAGAYRTYEFPITAEARPGVKNVIAVETFAPTEKDLGINWVDWNPAPADKNMGLWRGVWLSSSGPVALRHPQIVSKVQTGESQAADLTISAEVTNTTSKPIQGKLTGTIERLSFSQPIDLAPGETKVVTFTPANFPQLHIANPRLWWPWQMGRQEMYTLRLAVQAGSRVSDEQNVRFGIREVKSEMTPKGYRVFSINGKRILIRGGGWSPDMLLRENPSRLEEQIRYTRDLNLNAIRLEGKMESEAFFDLTDRYGILVMAGWCCCDIWEKWKEWPEENHKIASESLRSQLLRMRNRPSVFVWLNGSDMPPTADVEQAYLEVEKQTNWPNPVVSSASQQPTTVTGPSGVKMTGPYDWVPPAYWYIDTKNGGAYGFNTETSPGPAVPPADSLRRFIPKDHEWPIDQVWNYHAGLEGFTNIDYYRDAMKQRYGASDSMDQFATRSQAIAYEGERAMFEAYSRNKYNSTGVIQWMLNNAWPSLIWHLYDYYLMPAGGYFGTKKATEPLHAVYGYDDRSVSVINSTYAPVNNLTLSTHVYNFDLSEKYKKEAPVQVEADGVSKVLELPEIDGLSTTYFVRLQLRDSSGKIHSDNFYWLSTKPDTYDWSKTDYRTTPVIQHADLTALAGLPSVQLEVRATGTASQTDRTVKVRVRNPSKNLAFMTRVRVLDGKSGTDILPIQWDDNFVSMLPGEERVLTASYKGTNNQSHPQIRIEGWNIVPKTIAVAASTR